MHQFTRARCETHQTAQAVGEALGLKYLRAFNGAASAHNGVARAGQDILARINGARARFQLTREAVVHAVELCFFRVTQIQIRKQLPNANRGIADPGVFNLAPPADEARQRDAGDAVGEQKIQVFLRCQLLNEFFHLVVTIFK